jgi:hypothetical protein
MFLVGPLAWLWDEVIESPNQRSSTNRLVGCCFSGCWHWMFTVPLWHGFFASCLVHFVCWFEQTDCRVLAVFLWVPPCIAHRSTFQQVGTSCIMTNLTLFKHYLTNLPFLDFTVLLNSMTFATTLILLNRYFLVTAWSCENNSTVVSGEKWILWPYK